MDTFHRWTGDNDMTIAFASINIVGALIIAVLMMITTPRASLKRATHDAQAMWGMIRRALYVVYVGGLMGMGLWVIEGWIVLGLSEQAFWLMVTVPIGIFILFRATGLVDQDYWVGLRRGTRPRSVHEATSELRDVIKDIQNPVRRNRGLRAVADLDAVATNR